jgi:hypothetical protein
MIDNYDTHDFEMRRERANHYGEPTYVALCVRCNMTASEASILKRPCPAYGDDNDQHRDTSVPRTPPSNNGGPHYQSAEL